MKLNESHTIEEIKECLCDTYGISPQDIVIETLFTDDLGEHYKITLKSKAHGNSESAD